MVLIANATNWYNMHISVNYIISVNGSCSSALDGGAWVTDCQITVKQWLFSICLEGQDKPFNDCLGH
jgi:hypothetical protein